MLESCWINTVIKVVIVEINVDSLVLLRDIVIGFLLYLKFTLGCVKRE